MGEKKELGDRSQDVKASTNGFEFWDSRNEAGMLFILCEISLAVQVLFPFQKDSGE